MVIQQYNSLEEKKKQAHGAKETTRIFQALS